MRIHGLVPWLALGLVTLGCSSERASTIDTAVTTAPPAVAPDGSDAGDRAADDTATTMPPTAPTTTTLPPGSMGARVPDTTVRFAVPELYTELNPNELAPDFYQSASFADLAARVDAPSPETFELALRDHLALFFFAPADASGVIGKVTVDVRADTALPAAGDQRTELSEVGDVQSVETVELSGVPTLQSRYVTPAATTDEPLYAFDVMVVSNGALVDITATTTTETETDALATLITQTLQVGK